MAITTMSIDGVIREDGTPVILEFNRGVNSGSWGYEYATRQRILPKILNDLKTKAGFDHIWFMGKNTNWARFDKPKVQKRYSPYEMNFGFFQTLKPKFSPSSRHLVYPDANYAYVFKNVHGKTVYYNNDIDFKPCTQLQQKIHYDKIEGLDLKIADFPVSFNALYQDKSLITALINQGIVNPSSFPVQSSFNLYADAEELAQEIHAKFSGHEKIVLKHPSLARGDGIHVLNAPTIDEILVTIEELGTFEPAGINWDEDNSHLPKLVVQEFVEGRSISLRQSFAQAKEYLLSPRSALWSAFAMTAMDTSPRNHAFRLFTSYVDGDLILHDGWLKFSSEPKDSASNDKFISGRTCAGPLPRSEKERIFEAVKQPVTTIFNYLSTTDDPQFQPARKKPVLADETNAEDNLNSDDEPGDLISELVYGMMALLEKK